MVTRVARHVPHRKFAEWTAVQEFTLHAPHDKLVEWQPLALPHRLAYVVTGEAAAGIAARVVTSAAAHGNALSPHLWQGKLGYEVFMPANCLKQKATGEDLLPPRGGGVVFRHRDLGPA